MFLLAWLLVALKAFSWSVLPEQPACAQSGQTPGNYSQLSIALCFQDVDNGRRHLEIPSPDRSVLLMVEGDRASFQSNGRQVGPAFSMWRDVEIIWSPDSRMLIETMSFGAAGPVRAGFGFVDPNISPEVPDVVKRIQKNFASRHPGRKCHDTANVAGLAWLEGSKRAVLVAEIPPSPGCRPDGGYFEAYVVSLPQEAILERYDMGEVAEKWGKVLGPSLKADLELQRESRKLRGK